MASRCPCGRSPDPGVRPGGGCYCVDLPHCEHGRTLGFDDCPDCCREERNRYWQALVDIAGYEAWQGDPKPAVIAGLALKATNHLDEG